MMKERNHYIQNRLLKNFATKSDNGKFKICVIDLIKFNAEFHNTDSAFYEKNLYDLSNGDDIKELETKFATIIENPITNIFNKIQNNSLDKITFTRTELETIKKYLLLQIYRTPRNKQSYVNPQKNSLELSKFNIRNDENNEDFWKREMLTILDSNWRELLTTDMVGVKMHARKINDCFMMLVKTNDEFCINDLGYVTERIPLKINPNYRQEFIQLYKNNYKQINDKEIFDEATIKEIENGTCYIDNYILFPISSNYAILLVSSIWKNYLYDQKDFISKEVFCSPILVNHISLPENNYINSDKIKSLKDLNANLDANDTFTYTIHTIDEDETILLNTLIINEAYHYIGLKTPSSFFKTISAYNSLMQNGTGNVCHNLNGYIELLKHLN